MDQWTDAKHGLNTTGGRFPLEAQRMVKAKNGPGFQDDHDGLLPHDGGGGVGAVGVWV